MLVETDVDVADELTVPVDRGLGALARFDVVAVDMSGDQALGPLPRMGELPVLQGTDLGVVAIGRERVDVSVVQQAHGQAFGPEGVGGCAHHVIVTSGPGRSNGFAQAAAG